MTMDRLRTAAAVLHYAEGTIGPVDFHPDGCGTCAWAVELVSTVDRTYPDAGPTRRAPVDIIANAIRVADGNDTMGAGDLAEVVARVLDDDAIVDNAVRFLRADQRENGSDSAIGRMDRSNAMNQFLAEVARLVLASVRHDEPETPNRRS